MIRAIIVDDEPLGRQRIRFLLDMEEDVEIIGECENGFDAIDAIDTANPDLVFLDVQMPLVDGFGVLDALSSDRIPAVIFVTAFDQYAIKAFEVNALDYLLKPFDRDRFKKALQRARVTLKQGDIRGQKGRVRALLEYHQEAHNTISALDGDASNSTSYPERIAVKTAGQINFLPVAEINWIEAAGNYVGLHVGDRTLLLRSTMSEIESKINPNVFVRVHRSIIVRKSYVRSVSSSPNGEYVITLANNAVLNSSRSYRSEVQSMSRDP